jgi:hypothetical protein
VGFIVGCLVDMSRLFAEIDRSPLALPIAAVVLWRVWRKLLDFELVTGAIILSYVAVRAFPENLGFLPLQDHAYQIFLRGAPDPAMRDLVMSWGLDRKFLSIRAAGFAFYIFCCLLVGKQRHWYTILGKLVIVLVAVAALTWAVYVLLLDKTMAWIMPNPDYGVSSDQTLLSLKNGLEYYVALPLFAAATSMLLCLFIWQLVTYLREFEPKTAYSVVIVNLLSPVLVLFTSIYALRILHFWQALLWIVFLVTAYPIVLGFTRTGAADRSILSLFRVGIRQLWNVFSARHLETGRP